MTSKNRVLQRECSRGRSVGTERGREDALDLAARAPEMDDTAIIAEESKVPAWCEYTDYTTDHVGCPVQDAGQVYRIQMPHTPANNPGSRPADLRAIYSLLHTKDPAKAKPWMPSYGTSGLYKLNEVCTYPNAEGVEHVWRNCYDNNEYPPLTLHADNRWEDLGAV